MTTVTTERHRRLQHRLPKSTALLAANRDWIRTRAARYAAFAGVTIEITTDPAAYCHRTGRPSDPARAGEVYFGSPDQRHDLPLVLINPVIAATRGDAECVIAHEIAHVRWPSYGHKTALFQRAQQLLDAMGSTGHPPGPPR